MKKLIFVLLALFAFSGIYAMQENKEDTVLLFRDFLSLKSDMIRHCMENTMDMAKTTCSKAAKLKELDKMHKMYLKKLDEVDRDAKKVVTHVEFKKASDRYEAIRADWQTDFKKLLGIKEENK